MSEAVKSLDKHQGVSCAFLQLINFDFSVSLSVLGLTHDKCERTSTAWGNIKYFTLKEFAAGYKNTLQVESISLIIWKLIK